MKMRESFLAENLEVVPKHEGNEHTELLNGHKHFEYDVNRAHLHITADNPAMRGFRAQGTEMKKRGETGKTASRRFS